MEKHLYKFFLLDNNRGDTYKSDSITLDEIFEKIKWEVKKGNLKEFQLTVKKIK